MHSESRGLQGAEVSSAHDPLQAERIPRCLESPPREGEEIQRDRRRVKAYAVHP